jgi:outer membrane protein TolC
MLLRLLVAMMWVVSACSVSWAQTPTLSWLEYQKILFDKNISLQSSYWAVTASMRARDIAGANAWPEISLGASATHTEGTQVSDLFSYSLFSSSLS